MKTKRKTLSFLFCGSFIAANLASAASLQWDANGATAGQTNGGGNWLGANLWWDGTANTSWTSGDDATFGGAATAGGAVTLAGTTSVGSITFNQFTGTYTLGTAGTANTLTINGGMTINSSAAAVTYSSPITVGATQSWVNNSGSALTLNGAVSIGSNSLSVGGSGSVTFGAALGAGTEFIKTGTGRVVLHNSSPAFTGAVTVNGGVLQYGDQINWLTTGNITLNGGVIEQRWSGTNTRAQGTAAGQIQILGGESGFSENGNTGLTWNIGAVTWGSTTFNPSKFVLQTSLSQGNSAVTFSSAINLNGADRTVVANAGVTGAATSTLSGNITNSSTTTAGLIKEGPGQLLLTGTNTYNGNTTVSTGVLTATVTGALPGFASAGRVIVADGATIAVRTGASWTAANIDSLRSNATWSAAGSQLGIDTTGGNFSYASNISQALTLNKRGNNTLTLTGNNSYTGGTVLSAGTLSIGSATAIPSTSTISFNGGGIQSSDATVRTLSNTIALNSNVTVGTTGNLTFSDTSSTALGATRTFTIGGGNTTFAQAFTGSGAGITKAGAGTLTLTGNSTFTGATTISAGTVVLNNDGDVTSSAVGFTGNNSGLTITGGSEVTSIWNNNGGAFGGGANVYNNVQVLIDGAGTAGSARVTNINALRWGNSNNTMTNSTITLTNGGQMNVSGTIGFGSSYYSRNGGANMTIGGGTATSTFTGNNQSFFIGEGSRAGANNNVVTVNSGGVLTNIGNMFVGDLNYNGVPVGNTTANKFTVSGTGTASMASITVGNARQAAVGSATNANELSVTSGGSLTTSGANYIGRAYVANSIANANTATITGTGSSWAAGNQNVFVGFTANATATSNNNILSVGSGATMSGVATLTVGQGAGTETGNQLVVNGSLTATTVSVSAGNSLAGGGSITGNVTLSGSLAPGSGGIGTLSNTGNVTWNGGSNLFQFDLSNSSTSSDKLAITGNFAKGTGSTFKFNFLGAAPAYNTTYDLVTWTGTTGFSSGDFSYENIGGNFSSTSFFTITGSTLQFTAVPEASNLLIGGLLGLGLMSRRRKNA